MKLVIEIEDFSDEETIRGYLASMQQESDEYAADPPEGEEYAEGFGPLALETTHMSVSSRIVGVLEEYDERYWGGQERYTIDPISPGE